MGLVQDGTVVCERVLCESGRLTVGRSERNDLILYDPGAPRRLTLFTARGEGFELLFDEGSTGRVATGDRTVDLDEAIAGGLAFRRGGRFAVGLELGSRGRIEVGELSVLFQVVRPPIPRPRPALPAALRGGPLRSSDRRPLPFLMAALLFHAGLIAYWQTTDWPLRPLIDPLVASGAIATVIPEPIWIDRDEQQEEPGGEWMDEDEDPWEELKRDRTRAADRRRDRNAAHEDRDLRDRAEQRAEVLSQILEAAERQAGVIGSRASATGLVFGQGPTGTDMERLLGQLAYGPAAAEQSSLSRLAGGKDHGEVASVDALRLPRGDLDVETQGAGQERDVGKVRRDEIRRGRSEGYLDEAQVKRIFGRALPAIKGCYERALPRNPTLEGRLEVHFTVAGSGKVSAAQIAGNELNAQVGRCVAGVFKRLRFPQPQGGAARFELPFFFTPAF